MTNEEVIEKLSTCENCCSLLDGTCLSDNGCFEAKKIAIENMYKSDKYRWHDLRKNPEDLPPTYRWVMCACQGNQYQVMRLDIGGDWLTWFPDCATYMNSFVIAWREIEPFEEEE